MYDSFEWYVFLFTTVGVIESSKKLMDPRDEVECTIMKKEIPLKEQCTRKRGMSSYLPPRLSTNQIARKLLKVEKKYK